MLKRKMPKSIVSPTESPIEGTKMATDLFRDAKRFVSLCEYDIALENLDEALGLATVDNEDFNRADALFMAAQICRRLKDYSLAIKYIKTGIDTVDPYRADSTKFIICQGVINMQVAEAKGVFSRRSRNIKKAKESFEVAINVSEMFISGNSEKRHHADDMATIKKYHQIALFDLAYLSYLTGNKRDAIKHIDILHHTYPSFLPENTTFGLFDRITGEKKASHTAK